MIGGTPAPLQPGFEWESVAHCDFPDDLALFLPGIYLTGAPGAGCCRTVRDETQP
jgi:hypothetical protein